MARGDTPQPDGGAGPNEPDAPPDGEAARQRDILAQVQDAITADARPAAADARPATADARAATADARPATADARPATADARPARAATADAGPARVAPARDRSEPGNGPATRRGELRERSVQFRHDQYGDRSPR